MTCQCHGTEEGIYHPQDGGDALGNSEEGDSYSGVAHEDPDERCHDGTGLISRVHPYTLFLASAEGEGPRVAVV